MGLSWQRPEVTRAARSIRSTETRNNFGGGGDYRRRFVRDGGSDLQLFKTTTAISAATGFLAANRGSGTVQPLVNETGENDGDPIEISNPAFDAFTDNSIGWMNTSSDPPLIVSVFCTESE